jgi:hypothetical protein
MLTKSASSNINLVNKKYNIVSAAKNNIHETNQSVLILNVCNNMNAFGAGFNKIIADVFPIAKENYHMLGSSALKNKLGYTQFVKVETNEKHKNQIVVANMICQTGIISSTNPRPFNYYYFGICLAKIQDFLKQYKSDSDLDMIIYSPKIHGGVTGANWSFVHDMMLDVLKKPTYVMVYE